MTPKEILQDVDAIAQAAVFLDAESSIAEFDPLRQGVERVHAAAQEAGLAVLADVTELGRGLLAEEKLADTVLRPALMVHLEHMITLLSALAEELFEFGEPRTSVKGELADIRLFLNEADETATPVEPDKGTTSEEEEFLAEMMQRLDTVESTLINLPRGQANTEKILSIFREYHTLKGEAGVLGFSELNKWFHSVEDALDAARHRPISCTDDLIDAIMQVTDLSRSLMKGVDVSREVRSAGVNALHAIVAATPDAEQAVAPQASIESDEMPMEEVDSFFASMAGDAGVRIEDLEETAAISGSISEGVKDSEDANAASSWDGAASTACAESDTAPEASAMRASSSSQGIPSETASLPNVEVAASLDQSAVAVEEINRIPVSVEQIDHLLDRIGEVNTLVSLITTNKQVAAIADPSVQEDIHQLSIASHALQLQVMTLRMLPIQPLFQRMRRVAYDVSRTSHKRVEIVFHGENTRVDRGVMDHLATALVHLVRNAIDHGIESPKERALRGKSEIGIITINALRTGSDIVIELGDDGKGLDLESIRSHAIATGVITDDAVLSEKETLGLIFRSGFSTAKRVTTVSGRGVGMDAVNEAIKALRGSVDIENHPGQGVKIRLTFPVSLSAVEALFVNIGSSRLAIPVHCVRESFRPQPDQVQHVKEKGTVVCLRGMLLPVIHLGKMLGLPYKAESAVDGLLVVVEQGGRCAVLLVDEVTATRQVLIRELTGAMADIPCIAGGVILENRQVGLVLEVQRLLEETSTPIAGYGEGDQRGDRIETIEIGYNRVGMVDFAIRHRTGERIESSRFAINAFKAREFVTMQDLTPLPMAPKGFAGMLMLRDKTIPVVDLAVVLDLQPVATHEDTVIICEFSGQTIGLRVSSVNRVNYISWNEILPPPEGAEMLHIRQIVGSILMEDDIVFLLDFERIVQEVIRLYAGFGDLLQGVEQRKSGSTVLLVEDSAIIRKQTAAALERAGLRVLVTCNGQEAMDTLLEMGAEVQKAGLTIFEKLDLVLSDIEMPLMDGYTLTRALKNHPVLRVLPVLLHSSLTNETIIRRAREVHADGFVPKCAPEELAEHLRRFL